MLLTDFKPKDMLDNALIVIDFGFERDATDDRRDDRGGQFFRRISTFSASKGAQ